MTDIETLRAMFETYRIEQGEFEDRGDEVRAGWYKRHADALQTVLDDAERFRAISEFDAVAINAHIVQVRRGDDFHTAYHKAPPSGVPKVLFDGDKLAALRAAVDSAMGK